MGSGNDYRDSQVLLYSSTLEGIVYLCAVHAFACVHFLPIVCVAVLLYPAHALHGFAVPFKALFIGMLTAETY